MRDTLPVNTMIFGGHSNGGKVIVARLWNLLGDDYHKSPVVYTGGTFLNEEDKNIMGDISRLELDLEECTKLENDIYFPGKPNPGRKYYAVLRKPGHVFFGAHDVMCDYHPIYALRDAIRDLRRHPKQGGLLFDFVCVASEHYYPDVMYKDRQHLLELNFQQECLCGCLFDPPVYLAMYEQDEKNCPRIKQIFKTSVKKWLPFAFSPANFGREFVENATEKFNKMR